MVKLLDPQNIYSFVKIIFAYIFVDRYIYGETKIDKGVGWNSRKKVKINK